MPKQSRRNRNKTTKTTVKTIKVKRGSYSWDILPQDLDDFNYYLSKCEKIQLAVSTYKIIAKQGIPDEAPQDDKEYYKYLKTASICSAYHHYEIALDTYKDLFKHIVYQIKLDDKEIELLKISAKSKETTANLYIYLHNKNYDKCLEYYSKQQKILNEQLDIMMFEDLSHLGLTARKGDGAPLDIHKDESVRGFAVYIKEQKKNIIALWKNFFHENLPTIALE